MIKKWNLVDIFTIGFIVLTGAAIYFTMVNPINFSQLIRREGVIRYAEVEILLPEDLRWMKESLSLGEESKNVYGFLDWKILAIEDQAAGGKVMTKVTVKVLATEESSGLIRYGKYTLVKGNRLYLINDHYFIEGRIFDFRMLEEKHIF